MQVLHYKFLFQGKSALQISFLMLRKFVMHLYEYDTFAMHRNFSPTSCSQAVFSSVFGSLACFRSTRHRLKVNLPFSCTPPVNFSAGYFA